MTRVGVLDFVAISGLLGYWATGLLGYGATGLRGDGDIKVCLL